MNESEEAVANRLYVDYVAALAEQARPVHDHGTLAYTSMDIIAPVVVE